MPAAPGSDAVAPVPQVAPAPEPPAPAAGTRVEGKVTYNAEPLAGATLALVARDGESFTAELGDNGSFTMQVPPGDYALTVRTTPNCPKPAPAKYSDSRTSSIRVSVREGTKNQFLIELSD